MHRERHAEILVNQRVFIGRLILCDLYISNIETDDNMINFGLNYIVMIKQETNNYRFIISFVHSSTKGRRISFHSYVKHNKAYRKWFVERADRNKIPCISTCDNIKMGAQLKRVRRKKINASTEYAVFLFHVMKWKKYISLFGERLRGIIYTPRITFNSNENKIFTVRKIHKAYHS